MGDHGTERAAQPRTGVQEPGARVTLLGDFRLQVAGRSVELGGSCRRVVALVCLRGAVPRARAAGTLWPSVADQRAGANLRTALWRVGLVAPFVLRVDRGWVELGLAVTVDVQDLTQRALAVDEPDDEVTSLSRLADADLLPDWDDEWVAEDRERVRQLRLHLLEAVARRLASESRFAAAVNLALTALRADPLRESAHRTVIAVHLAEGNLAEARRAFAACRQLLRRELGVEPSAATAALVARLVPDRALSSA
ncbi:AfsR/SARP family transcriptional regulator [Cellulomonas gelida]|uniref:Bacterial transcriptional activator domain-containing protein n=1 Tax=Cellulomonas gelida TaxID=1712 RepID=A0A4Y3KIY5_9CELL|nr:BTAD domain-containing putative transcriptional regulator [Cellulomonas gelida]GEA84369.1 hypothetical protein CGE01nite_16200 [Cellulomonas gelida]GGL26161.1 hypothetical protein GCM10009774_15730 [Cellulomonas gelida]